MKIKAVLACTAICLALGCTVGRRFSDGGYDNLDTGIPSECDRIIDRAGYAVGYSYRLKQPLWVQYRLTKEEVQSNAVKRINRFVKDPDLAEGAAPEDYAKSGYDKGHLAPAADMHWSTNAMLESFYMGNMSPQAPELNRFAWADLEALTRKFAETEGSIVVVSGPVCTNSDPKKIGYSGIIVPDAFYKVLYDETYPEKMVAFIMPNGAVTNGIFSCATNVIYVEQLTGLTFFPEIEAETSKSLKSRCDLESWRPEHSSKKPFSFNR